MESKQVRPPSAQQADHDATRLELLVSCVRLLSSSTNYADMMDAVLGSIVSYYGAARGYVFEFDWDAGECSNTFESVAPGVTAEKDGLQGISLDAVRPWVKAFAHRDYFVIENVADIADDPDRADEFEILERQGISRLLAVPIRRDGALHGFLGVDDATRHQGDFEFLVNLTFFICNEMEKRALNEELYDMAYYDSLTGVYNRRYFGECCYWPENASGSLSFIMADLSNFKSINDRFGHSAGDRVLVDVAKVLRNALTGNDKVVRFGGDEFLLILVGRDEEFVRGVIDNLKRAAMTVRFGVNGEFPLGLDCGYAIRDEFDGSARTIEQMVRDADSSMYLNKTQSRKRDAASDDPSEIDGLTRLPNSVAYASELARIKTFMGGNVGIVCACITNLRTPQTILPRHPDAEVIASAVNVITSVFRRSDVFRIAGDTFMVLAVGMPKDRFATKAGELAYEFERNAKVMTVASGSAWCDDDTRVEHYVSYAERQMQMNREKGIQAAADPRVLRLQGRMRRSILVITDDILAREALTNMLSAEYDLTFAGDPHLLGRLSDTYAMLIAAIDFKSPLRREYYYEASKVVNFQDIPVIALNIDAPASVIVKLNRYGVNAVYGSHYDPQVVKASVDSFMRLTSASSSPITSPWCARPARRCAAWRAWCAGLTPTGAWCRPQRSSPSLRKTGSSTALMPIWSTWCARTCSGSASRTREPSLSR